MRWIEELGGGGSFEVAAAGDCTKAAPSAATRDAEWMVYESTAGQRREKAFDFAAVRLQPGGELER